MQQSCGNQKRRDNEGYSHHYNKAIHSHKYIFYQDIRNVTLQYKTIDIIGKSRNKQISSLRKVTAFYK